MAELVAGSGLDLIGGAGLGGVAVSELDALISGLQTGQIKFDLAATRCVRQAGGAVGR